MNEYEVAHAKALEMNSAYVNIQGHGTRAYQLLSIEHGIATVRPLSKGLEWSHDAYKVIRPN